jgi:hypothetical protein
MKKKIKKKKKGLWEVGDNEDFVPFCKNMVIKAFLIKRKLVNFIT